MIMSVVEGNARKARSAERQMLHLPASETFACIVAARNVPA